MEINSKSLNLGSGCKKGQFFSYDAIIAGALFSVLLAILFIYWSSIHSLVFNQLDDMYRVGITITDILLTTGSPTDWTPSNIHQVGLTDGFGSIKLNSTKVGNLRSYANSNYAVLKEKLGSGRYDFLIEIEGSNLDIGQKPSNPTGLITIKRPVIYNDQPSMLTVTLWMNYTA